MSADPPPPADVVLMDLVRRAVVAEIVPGVAHELSNVLTTVLGHVRILLSRADVADDLRERLQLAASEGARAAQLLQTLQVAAREPGAERRPCSLADQIRRALDLSRDRLNRDGVRVVVELAASPVVRANEPDLQRAVLALVHRAADAMRAGDVRVLTVRTGQVPGGACLEIVDSGPSVDRAIPAGAIDALTSAPPAVELLLARHVVAAHGGRLVVSPGPEGGTAVTMVLPAASSAA